MIHDIEAEAEGELPKEGEEIAPIFLHLGRKLRIGLIDNMGLLR
jgi:hypothetical protein